VGVLLKVFDGLFGGLNGPEGIRTLGHLVKSQMLYLAELQALPKWILNVNYLRATV
jgi:hypothetical protein